MHYFPVIDFILHLHLYLQPFSFQLLYLALAIIREQPMEWAIKNFIQDLKAYLWLFELINWILLDFGRFSGVEANISSLDTVANID